MPSLIPPPPFGADFEDASWKQFFEILRKQANAPVFYNQTIDPSLTDITNGTWSIWKNTTSGIVKLWVNDGGVLKSVIIS